MDNAEPEAEILWTSAFFNERFPDPVSPLGWSIIRELVEQIAFREPMHFVGYQAWPGRPLTRLWHNRPFANVRIFQILYKHFPVWLLPEDARRYFPQGDTSLRHAIAQPTKREFLIAVFRTFLFEQGWSPRNYRAWERFLPGYEAAVATEMHSIQHGMDLQTWLASLDRLMHLSRRLLRLHRWSLTYAEISYTLLRRMVRAWINYDRAGELCAILVGGVPNKSTESDTRLWQVAQVARSTSAETLALLTGPEPSAVLLDRLRNRPDAHAFLAAFDTFLVDYGHRSRSLDIFHPPLADDPAAVLDLVRDLLRDPEAQNPLSREAARQQARQSATQTCRMRLWLRRPLFNTLLALTRRYMQLREDQRFYWQKALHAQRRALLKIGEQLGLGGLIFFLTLDEVRAAACGEMTIESAREQAAMRRHDFEQPISPYPAFLRGDIPLDESSAPLPQTPVCSKKTGFSDETHPIAVSFTLRGIGASPGTARGRACLVTGLDRLTSIFAQVNRKTILIAPSTDPGWTPLFMKIGGLVMERGGLLSHGAVVAREYGLPAVVGVAGALAQIRDGQLVEIDGYAGLVRVWEEGTQENIESP